MYASNGKGSIIRLVSGLLIIISIILSRLVNPYWLILTGLVGVFLTVSALTGFCMGAIIFRALGVPDRK
ncbi:MAG: DUF2892 domain-containing protein [Firmicutes bacterium HGW-Firmicutes-14]|nr:MAG: DUF2892 domain-containing protein [Firmicutes bacterium HGW-Firmicutes-14]